MAEYDINFLADWPGWTVTDRAGRFQVALDDDWHAVVREAVVPRKTYERFHIAIVHNGIARYTSTASTVPEARRVAEQQVRGLMAADR